MHALRAGYDASVPDELAETFLANVDYYVAIVTLALTLLFFALSLHRPAYEMVNMVAPLSNRNSMHVSGSISAGSAANSRAQRRSLPPPASSTANEMQPPPPPPPPPPQVG